MNSLTKRLVAGVAAAATLLSGMALAGSAMAADYGFTADDLSAKQTLTVTDSTNKDLLNKTLVAVRLAKYTAGQYDENDKITGYDIETMDEPSGLKSAIEAAAKKAAGSQASEVDSDNPMLWVIKNLTSLSDGTANSATAPYDGTLRDFLTELAKSDVVKNASGSTLSVNDDGSSASAGSVDSGIYAIVDKTPTDASANGAQKIIASIPMMTGTAIGTNGKHNTLSNGTTLGTIEYKATLPTITKKITASGSAQGDGAVKTDSTASVLAVGDDVDYTLTANIPNWNGYDSYYLAMNDTLGAGLTLKQNSFTVKVGDTTLTADTDYRITVDGQSFRILFAPVSGETITSNLIQNGDTKSKFPVGGTITVTYKATLNKNAVIGDASDSAGNPNTVNLEYSNNPSTTDHGKTDDITVKSYTGELTIQKRDPKGNVDPILAGSTFAIKKKNAAANLKFLVGADGVYTLVPDGYVADAGETVSETLTVPTSGNIIIKGLNGEYTITETKSAYGATFGLPSFDATVAVSQTNGNVTVTNKADTNQLVAVNSTAAANGAIVVKNVRNFTEMPKTGATWLCIYAAMALLCGGGAFLLLRSSKKNS